MKAGEVHDMDDVTLVELVGNAREEVFNLRFQGVTGALENTARLKLAKREIARILTIRNERESSLTRESHG